MDKIDSGGARVRKVIVEIRYPTAVGFFEKRGELIAVSETDSVNVKLQENRIEIDDRSNQCVKQIGFFTSSITSQRMETVGGFLLDVAGKWLQAIMDVMSVEELRRIGVRQLMVFPCDQSFESLVGQFVQGPLAINDSSWEIMDGRPYDVGLALDFELGEHAAHLKIGPMKAEQMANFFERTEDVPEVGIFVDWDYYTRSTVELKGLNPFLREVKDHLDERIKPFLESL